MQQGKQRSADEVRKCIALAANQEFSLEKYPPGLAENVTMVRIAVWFLFVFKTNLI